MPVRAAARHDPACRPSSTTADPGRPRRASPARHPRAAAGAERDPAGGPAGVLQRRDVDVDRAVLVGRAPEARRFTASDQPRLVTVPSPHQEISSTHLEVRPGAGADHGSAVVTDLGSTNGTVLVQPGLPPEDLQPGIAVQLIPGAIIDLGDGVTIQVDQPLSVPIAMSRERGCTPVPPRWPTSTGASTPSPSTG